MYLIILIGFLALFSCQSHKDKKIDPEFGKYIAAFTAGNIHNESNIEIELMQDVSNIQIGDLADDGLFEFSPSIKGKAYWKTTNRIIFEPEEGALKPGTTYDAWFNLSRLFKVDEKFKSFYFSFSVPKQYYDIVVKPYSPIDDENLSWNRVEALLTLSNTVNVNELQKSISIDDKQAKISISAIGSAGVYKIVVDSLFRSETQAKTYSLKVDGDNFGAVNGNTSYEINIPAMPDFDVLSAEIVFDPQECIRVTFSDPLSTKQNLQRLLTINEKYNFSYELEKNILKIYVDAKTKENVNLVLFKEIKNSMNKPLKEKKSYDLTFTQHEPEVKLLSDFNIIPKAKSSIYYFQAVNLWAVDVSIVKIYDNNILYYLQRNDFGENNSLKYFGKLIKKERIRLDVDPSVRLDRWNTFPIDLSALFEQDPGAIYKLQFSFRTEYSTYGSEDGVLSLKDREEYVNKTSNFDLTDNEKSEWDAPSAYDGYSYYDDDYYYDDYSGRQRSKTAFVLSSNVGIMAKQGASNSYTVVVNDLITTDPIANSDVTIYNFQMQKVGTAKTDEQGFATVSYSEERPFVLTASNGRDLNYLKIVPNQSLSLSNFDVSGAVLRKGLQAYLYGERGVWRPGDSIYLTMILDDREGNMPDNHPANLELFTPQGELYKNYVVNGKNGFYSFRMTTTDDAETGTWLANIKVGGVQFSKNLKIETIKPNRLKIRLITDEVIDGAKSSVKFDISSQWLHGAPAANLKADVELLLTPKHTSFKKYEQYVFNDPISSFYSESTTIFDGKLDEQGETSFTAKMPSFAAAPGLLNAKFISRVYENGGDASIYVQNATYSPYSSYVGLKVPEPKDGRWLETDIDYKLDIVTVEGDGKLTDIRNMNVKIYKVGWSWWWNNNSGDLSSYVNNSNATVLLNQDFSTSSGKAQINFRIAYPNWGRFLVLVTDKDSGHRTGQTIYVDWPAYRGRADMNEAGGESMLNFSADKSKYNVGEKATIILPKSSDGRALVSIEDGAKILHKEWVKTSGSSETKYTFDITAEMAPNIYVFVSLLQPHNQENNSLPIRMYGVVNIDAEDKTTILEPTITMPEELKPEQEYRITVSERNKKEMTYTLAVVDEGLLDLTAFKTPNAWSTFYAKQALGIRTWDLYNYVLGRKTGKIGPLLSIGGDEELGQSNETVKRFKPVVQFVGPFTLKAGSSETHNLKMPAYFGSVRVMVVAGNAKNKAYGSTQKTVPVRNPLMILSTLPRVAGPGEEIVLPVNVFAMNDNVKNVKVKVSAQNGLFDFTDGTEQNVSFSKSGDQTVYFKLKVANKTGAEKIVITASSGSETATETIDIEVRNPNPYMFMDDGELLKPGATADLKLSFESLNSTDWAKLELSRMPGLDLNKSIKYLFEYPHGCAEQVTSRTFPALFIHKFKSLTKEEKVVLNQNVQTGIELLGARQKPNGGFAYWPGGDYINEWASTYATHFVVEADRAGYKVPSRIKNNAISFLKKAVNEWTGKPLYTSYYSETMSPLQQAYRLYVLALANQPELAAMNRLKEYSQLDTQTKWRLAAAYALAGRKDVAKEILSRADTNVATYSYSNDTYGSSARDLAMIIQTQVLMDDIEGAMKLAQELAKQVNNSDYLTTQTAAYSLLAMSELSDKVGSSPMSVEWELNGKKQKTEVSDKVYVEIPITPQAEISVRVKNNGASVLNTRLVGVTQPFVEPNNPQSNGLSLNVTYEDESKRPISVARLKQGTEFYAVVSVQNKTGRYASDLTLTEIFASGWEIFNTRLFAGTSNSNFNYQDIRDDRVYTYFNLGANENRVFRIKLQAAYCGKFYLPSVYCDAMYNPALNARTTGQWVEVYK